jgi:hypothetical protein
MRLPLRIERNAPAASGCSATLRLGWNHCRAGPVSWKKLYEQYAKREVGLIVSSMCDVRRFKKVRILDPAPLRRSTGAVSRAEPLRHDALAAELTGVLIDDDAVVVQRDARSGRAPVWCTARLEPAGKFCERDLYATEEGASMQAMAQPTLARETLISSNVGNKRRVVIRYYCCWLGAMSLPSRHTSISGLLSR